MRKHKFLSVLMSIVLVVGLMPGLAYAAPTALSAGDSQLVAQNDPELPADLSDEGYHVEMFGDADFCNYHMDRDATVTPEVGLFYEEDGATYNVPEDWYTVSYQLTYWEGDNQTVQAATAPLGFAGPDAKDGYTAYNVVVTAVEGKGLEGSTSGELNLCDRLSLDKPSANADFEGYERGEGGFGPFEYRLIPLGDSPEPTVTQGEDEVDDGCYTVEYYAIERPPMEEILSWAGTDNAFDWREKQGTKLDGFPTEPGTYACAIKGVNPYYGTVYIDFDVVLPTSFEDEGYHVTVNGTADWVGMSIGKDETVTPEVALVYGEGDDAVQIDEDNYEVTYELTYWQGDVQSSEPAQAPLGLAGPDAVDGWCEYEVVVSAVEGSGFKGSAKAELRLADVHAISMTWATFPDCERGQGGFGPFEYVLVPLGQTPDPVVLAEENDVDSALGEDCYTVEYYAVERPQMEEIKDWAGTDNAFDWREKLGTKLDGFPTELGTYACAIKGVDPYYGTVYIDFDVVLPADLSDDCYQVYVNGKPGDWHSFTIAVDGTLTPEVGLFYEQDGVKVEVPADVYEQSWFLTYWDDQAGKDVYEPVVLPLKVLGGRDKGGFTEYQVRLSAVEGGRFTEYASSNVMVKDQYSLNMAQALFDEQYQHQGPGGFGPFEYYVIPVGVKQTPRVVQDDEGLVVVPTNGYTVGYYKVVRPEDLEKVQGFDWRKQGEMFTEFPTEPGTYACCIEGVEPYYGTQYIDFDVTAATFTVTFNSNGGSEVAAKTVTENAEGTQTVDKPDDPTKASWAFGGWCTDEACTKAYDFTTPVTNDLTLNAKWVAIEEVDNVEQVDANLSEVSLALKDNETKAVLTVKDATETASDAAKAAKTDGASTFKVFDVTLSTVDKDGKEVRKLDGEQGNEFGKLALTFDMGKENAGKKATITQFHNGVAIEPAIVVALDADGKATVSDIGVLSEFAVSVQDFATFTVSFETNGGSAVAAKTVTENAEGTQKVDKPANPTKKNNTFGGWFADAACTKAYDFAAPVTADLTLYAKWTANSATMYRLYNKYTGEHFYTASASERDGLVKVGWTYEGIGWTAPATSNTPVYRLYNPYAPGGDHHYTTSAAERDNLVKLGWRAEGTGWYSDDAKSVPLYRQYNPYAEVGTHNYTTSKSENDKLVKLGWRAEGEAWYGVK